MKTVAITPLNPTIGDPVIYRQYIAEANIVSVNLTFDNPSDNKDILVITQNIEQTAGGYLFSATVIPFRTGVIHFPSASITVNSILKPRVTPNLKPDYQPYQDYSDYLAGLFIVLMLLAGYLYRRFKSKSVIEKKKYNYKQKQELWQKTIALFKQNPVDFKQYYFKSSENLKMFCDKILGLDIAEKTSREIRDELKGKSLAEKEELLNALENADWVKFAKYIPEIEEIKQYQQSALKFLFKHQPQGENDAE